MKRLGRGKGVKLDPFDADLKLKVLGGCDQTICLLFVLLGASSSPTGGNQC